MHKASFLLNDTHAFRLSRIEFYSLTSVSDQYDPKKQRSAHEDRLFNKIGANWRTHQKQIFPTGSQ